MNMELAGVFCALWTPLDEAGEVDERALRSNLEFILEQKVRGIMALGSTGEFPRLTTEQRKQVVAVIAELSAGRPLIANVSHLRWRTAVALGLDAKSRGATTISLLPPWFYPMDQLEIGEFFVRVAEAVQLPLSIYNFPEMTGKKVELETIREVARRVPVCAVKQSGADPEYHRDLARLAAELGFVLLSGADTDFPAVWHLGAKGTVSGLASAVPEVIVRLHAALAEGNPASVTREARFMANLGQLMARLPFPLNIQAAVEARGLAAGVFKSPVSAATREAYDRFVAELRVFYREARLF